VSLRLHLEACLCLPRLGLLGGCSSTAVYNYGCSVLSCCCMPSSFGLRKHPTRQAANSSNGNQVVPGHARSGLCGRPSGRPPRYRSLLPYHTVALCAVRALYLLPLRLLFSVERRGREQKRRTPLATIKNLRDCHDHQRWAEFDGGKRGAGQGKEGCLSARKTIVCTGIDATYVGLDSHAWHAVSRGCIETFLSGFVLPDCLY
jgi:hypothetical protein